jgi:hypothetical protein
MPHKLCTNPPKETGDFCRNFISPFYAVGSTESSPPPPYPLLKPCQKIFFAPRRHRNLFPVFKHHLSAATCKD